MNKRIFVFSHDPGGANTIVPLVPALKERGYDVLLYGKNFALKKYADAALEASDLSNELPESTVENVHELIQRKKPDAIITATSAIDSTEKYLWLAAERQGIPSFAILDQWCNYGVRFSPYDTTQLTQFANDKRFPYLPNFILLMDELAKREAVRDGLPENRLIIVGQPYFETVKKKVASISEDDKRNYRRACNVASDALLFIFASEPLSQEQGESGRYGYTEISSFRFLAEGIVSKCRKFNRRATIIIRPHPREQQGNLDNVLSSLPSDVIAMLFDDQSDVHLAMFASDVVCGMSSMFLIEAAIIGKPVLSLLPGLCTENPFVLDRLEVVRSITDRETLERKLDQIFDKNRDETCSRFSNFIDNPVGRVLDVLESKILQWKNVER